MTAIDAVLFDVGNVLIEWDPRHLYRQVFVTTDGKPDEARIEWFLSSVCTTDWHVQHDLGRSIAEQTSELVARHPEHQSEIEAFYARFQDMMPGAFEEIVAAKRAMKAKGLPVYGLTNFGAETFSQTRRRFDFLNAFDDVVVSGEEGLKKPDPAIFKLCIDRFGITPETTLFIDDTKHNTDAAEELGFRTHHFTDRDACMEAFRELRLI